MRRGQTSPARGLSIRQKLLLVITGLLSLSAALSLLLHLKESRRASREAGSAVERIFQRLREEGLVDALGAVAAPGESLEQGVAGLERDLEAPLGGVSFGRAVELSREVLLPSVDAGPGGWRLLLEHRRTESWFVDGGEEEPIQSGPAVIPPPTRTVLDELRDPIEATREASVPREITIAAAVLLFGFALTWLVAGRLTRPIKELKRKMDAVARGELDNVHSTASRRGDEIGQMTDSFDSMVESLREKRELEKKVFQSERLSALGDLAAGVAHDVRNPLNTIGLSLSHLRDRCSPEKPQDREQFDGILDDVKAELDRLNQLVHNFLSLARSEPAGEKAPCFLHDLVEDCLRLIRKQASSQSVTIREEIADVGTLDLDALEIRRAVTNVLLNALQALESGGTVEVRLSRRQERALLSIVDDGVGMSRDELDHVFLPYFTTRPEGTGLGMPIARGIVEAHGGSIEVRSGRGEGTTVEIALPFSPVPSMTALEDSR